MGRHVCMYVIVCVRVCLQSTGNPNDPVLQFLRSRNLLLPHRICTPRNGPPISALPLQIEPYGPLWLATDTAGFLNSLSQATIDYTAPSPLVSKLVRSESYGFCPRLSRKCLCAVVMHVVHAGVCSDVTVLSCQHPCLGHHQPGWPSSLPRHCTTESDTRHHRQHCP